MDTDRQRILQMLSEQKITVEQANILLDELRKNRDTANTPPQAVGSASAGSHSGFLVLIVIILVFLIIGSAVLFFLRLYKGRASVMARERSLTEIQESMKQESMNRSSGESRTTDAPQRTPGQYNESSRESQGHEDDKK